MLDPILFSNSNQFIRICNHKSIKQTIIISMKCKETHIKTV